MSLLADENGEFKNTSDGGEEEKGGWVLGFGGALASYFVYLM